MSDKSEKWEIFISSGTTMLWCHLLPAPLEFKRTGFDHHSDEKSKVKHFNGFPCALTLQNNSTSFTL